MPQNHRIEDAIRRKEKLIEEKHRRLHVLQMKQAREGVGHDPSTDLEIEDINKDLGEFNKDLTKLLGELQEKAITRQTTSREVSTSRSVVIYIQGLDNVPDFVVRAAIRAFAAVLGIAPESIEIFGVYRGSLILNLGIPSHAVDTLLELIGQNSKDLINLPELSTLLPYKQKKLIGTGYKLSISKVIVETKPGQREGWVLEESKYHLRLQSKIDQKNEDNDQFEKARWRINDAKNNNRFVLTLAGMHLFELPIEIWTLTNLRVLSLYGNSLTVLPSGIGNLSKLKKLNLRNNQLIYLPKEIAELKNLTHLDIKGNLVTDLPEELESFLKQNYKIKFDFDKEVLKFTR